jgi:hypothetical protein
VGNLAVRKVALDTVVVVVHKAEPDIAVVAARKAGLDIAIGADYMVGLDIETAHIETGIEAEAGYKVEMDIVDKAPTVVDMVFESYCTGLTLLEYTKVGRMDPCLLMYCHSHHKTGRLLRFVCRNFRTVLPPSVGQHARAHRARTAYKT